MNYVVLGGDVLCKNYHIEILKMSVETSVLNMAILNNSITVYDSQALYC